jgi:hypothetical protein
MAFVARRDATFITAGHRPADGGDEGKARSDTQPGELRTAR